jgi:hypothetical protein
MAAWHGRRLFAVVLTSVGMVMLLLAMFLPWFVVDVVAEDVRFTGTITGWSSISTVDSARTSPLNGSLPANGYLLAVSVMLLLGCVVIGLVAAKRTASTRIRQLAAVILAAAAAFTACTTLTIFLQATSWGPFLGFAGPRSPGPFEFYGVGLWILLAGAVFVVVAAVYAALPVREAVTEPSKAHT